MWVRSSLSMPDTKMKSPTDSHSRLSPICGEPSIATFLLSSPRLDQKDRRPETHAIERPRATGVPRPVPCRTRATWRRNVNFVPHGLWRVATRKDDGRRRKSAKTSLERGSHGGRRFGRPSSCEPGQPITILNFCRLFYNTTQRTTNQEDDDDDTTTTLTRQQIAATIRSDEAAPDSTQSVAVVVGCYLPCYTNRDR
jgi:hypothetical protein